MLDPLAFTRDDDLVLAGLLLLARLWEMTSGHIGMPANTQLFAAGLFARLLTLPTTVTLLLALVGTTLQGATADLTASDLAEPTRLVLDDILST